MNTLKAPKGSSTRKKIVGRGNSSGKGRTSTRGHKGLKARAGSTIKLGFEGGQMSLIRRLPKFGFSNCPHKKEYLEISLGQLDKIAEVINDITIPQLIKNKIISKNIKRVKILGVGKCTKKVTIGKDINVTKGARNVITAAGGTFS